MTVGMMFLILQILAMLSCSMGFCVFVYFISIGYGLAILVLGFSLLYIYSNVLSLGTIFLCILLIIYGARLGGYLIIRDMTSSFNKFKKDYVTDGKNIPLFVKITIWITTSLLYVLMVSPVFFRLANGDGSDLLTYIGGIIGLNGIILESLADYQKFKAKQIDSKRYVDTGLYKIVRCPNYLGELITWAGIFISGFSSLSGYIQWICASTGWIGITYIMFGGARRLELRQRKNYGNNPDYKKYVNTTPIILPGIPLYSVADYKWLKG